MALHHRLSLWQKILLGILCFPLLPFYLCVYHLCLEKDRKGDAQNKLEEGRSENGHRHFQNQVGIKEETTDGQKREEDAQPKIQSLIGIKEETTDDQQREEDSEPKNQSLIGIKEETTDGQQREEDPQPKIQSLLEEETTDGQKREEGSEPQIQLLKYPWDRSCLKSLNIDLKNFEKLDAYASKLEPKNCVDSLTKELILHAQSDLEKTRAIWMWICHHIEYDDHAYRNPAFRSSDPKDIFQARKGVCAGYASLFDYMCSIAGVQCKTVSGYAKGFGYETGQKISGDTDHAWNMVYLEGRWHLLDSTWGAGHAMVNISMFTFCYNEFYFLTHPALFIGDHFPESADCQLLETPLSLKQYERSANVHSSFYNLGLVSCQPQTAIIEAVKGKISIHIESLRNLKFSFHLNGQEKSGILTLLDNGMKLDVYPQTTGQHVLEIYAKKGDSEGNLTQVLEYKLDCKHIWRMKIPTCLYQPVGPSWLCEQAGLTNPSHPDPIIYTKDGSFTLSFLMKEKLHFLCDLKSDKVTMTPEMETQHILIKQTGDKMEMKVRLPQSGTYVLLIYIKPHTSNDDEYNYICNYLIICSNPAVKWPMFPVRYDWAEDYDLVQPLEPVLPKNTNIPFTLYIPDVAAVCVVGDKKVQLTLSDSGYWEGMYNTANSFKVAVMIKNKKGPSVWQHLIKYQVANPAR